MDRRRTFAALALALAAGAAAAPAPVLRELRWITPTLPRAEVVGVLTTAPGECLTPPADAATRAQVAVGRAMFSAPLLLGGQAARAGLSCAACHRGGRGNPHFVFPGVSGAPGTADVTSSLFSSRRGDGVANPRPIPDLAGDPPRVSRAPGDPALRQFIRGLIVEEFDGLEPPPRILDGLVAYVRALGPACNGSVARDLASDAESVDAAAAAAGSAVAEGDIASAHLLLAAARSALGRIDERFAGNADSRRRLARRDAGLRQLQALAASDARAAQAGVARWRGDFQGDLKSLRAGEPASLYAPAVLGRHLTPTAVR
ncbi:hypothetical protein IP88_06330 [alpha proteobacterium AAP81b]|nr:hypothetical protein IP88_06330 [alpha proteobacterium AAP81b]